MSMSGGVRVLVVTVMVEGVSVSVSAGEGVEG